MATPAVVALPPLPPFRKKKEFLDGKVDATLTATAVSSTVQTAIETNTPFPTGTIKLAQVAVGISGASGDLNFGGVDGPVVSFHGAAKAGGGLGVYPTSIEMLQDVADQGSIIDDTVLFPDHGTARYLALDWYYNINAAASGSVALGQVGQIKFGAEGSSAGRFVVIQRFAEDPRAWTAIQSVIEAWKLPRQIQDISDLQPGSWIVAEVNGGFHASIGAEVGFNYSWVRSVDLQGLSGDIGLKIQAAAEVSVGFEAAGKYALVISRESLDETGKQIRVRIRKLEKKGWEFALHAQVGVEPATGALLPASLDDFVSAIFGVQGAQIAEDLKELRRWTDPTKPLNTLAGDFLTDLAKQHFGGQMQAAFNDAIGFLKSWDDVGPRASSLLWSLVNGTRLGSSADQLAAQKKLDDLSGVLQTLAAGSDTVLRQLVLDQLAVPETAPNPIRKWLEAAAPAGALAALGSGQQLDQIRRLATLSSGILNGPTVNQLSDFINQRLNLKAVENMTFDHVDARLKEKLAQFLGKTLDAPAFDTIRATIKSILDKAGDLYQAAVKAANRKYSASLLSSYQSTTSSSALFDATFDFSKNAALGEVVKNVIQGDFRTNGVFTSPIAGLTLNQGQLTHGIRRQASLEISLPFLALKTGSITDSLAKLDFHPEGARILLDSSNEIFRAGQWGSRLAIHLDMPLQIRSSVRTFADSDELGEMMSVDYQFAVARPRLGAVQLQKQLEPIVNAYLPDAFGNGRATLEEWVADFDKNSDAVENNGTGVIGNTIVVLEASLPGRVLAGWTNAPADGKSPVYRAMSKNIQGTLRRLIPYVYFLDVSRYRGQNSPACALLLYASLPTATSVRTNGKTLEFDIGNGVYWDWRNIDADGDRTLMVNNSLTDKQLALQMDKASVVLASSGFPSDAKFYANAELSDIKQAATTGMGRTIFEGLLFTEAEVIQGAVDTGRRMGEFFSKKKEDDAIAKMDEFGAGIVENFNNKLTDLFDPKGDRELLRNLGLAVFLEATRALHPTLSGTPPTARLEIQVVKAAAAFPPAGFPLDYSLKAEDVVIDQPILSLGSSAMQSGAATAITRATGA